MCIGNKAENGLVFHRIRGAWEAPTPLPSQAPWDLSWTHKFTGRSLGKLLFSPWQFVTGSDTSTVEGRRAQSRVQQGPVREISSCPSCPGGMSGGHGQNSFLQQLSTWNLAKLQSSQKLLCALFIEVWFPANVPLSLTFLEAGLMSQDSNTSPSIAFTVAQPGSVAPA